MKRYCVFSALAILCSCRDHPHHPVVDSLIPLPPPAVVAAPRRDAAERATAAPVRRTDTAGPVSGLVEPAIDRSFDQARLIGELNGRLQDVFFMLDSSDVKADGIAVIEGDAGLLKAAMPRIPQLEISIEGHCDERGSAEYNLALGDRRAQSVRDMLRGFVPELAAVRVISYGKEAPQCTDATESCWQRNRRAHFVVKP